MAKKKTKPTLPDNAMRWKGPEQLWPLLVAVADLREDPLNANTHDDHSIDAIARSFERFGQQLPISSDADGVVRAGNGRLRAVCERLNWSHIAVVRSDLSGSELNAFSIADNKTPTFARIDQQRLLEQLQSLDSEEDSPVEATGYTHSEIQGLLDRLAAAHLEQSPPDPVEPSNDGEPGPGPEDQREPWGEVECPHCGEALNLHELRSRPR